MSTQKDGEKLPKLLPYRESRSVFDQCVKKKAESFTRARPYVKGKQVKDPAAYRAEVLE